MSLVLYCKMWPQEAEHECPPAIIETETVYVEVTQPAYYEDVVENITQEEIDLLSRIVYHEARGESLLGKRAVAEVVLNRVRNELFPDNIHDVLNAPNQFTSVSNLCAMKINDKEAYERCMFAVLLTISTPDPVLDEDVVYFMRATSFRDRECFERIGAHSFYYI